jgi:hypothetical protein
MSSAGAEPGDGPPPYRVEGRDRFESSRERDHPDWVELEVSLWISDLFWDPWQHPSTRSSPHGSSRRGAPGGGPQHPRRGLVHRDADGAARHDPRGPRISREIVGVPRPDRSRIPQSAVPRIFPGSTAISQGLYGLQGRSGRLSGCSGTVRTVGDENGRTRNANVVGSIPTAGSHKTAGQRVF